jgi:predicted MPP superfamily phosphohydrolase
MVSKVYIVFMDLMWRHPRAVAAGAGVLCALGIIVGASVSVLARRRRDTRQLTTEGWLPALALVAFCAGDWGLLWALPRLRLSFSTQIMPPLVASFTIRLLVFWGLLAAAALAHWRGRRRGVEVQSSSAVILFLAINLAFTAVQVDAYVVEPLLVETTELRLAFDDLDPTALPVRVVQLTDPHIERASFREARTVREVNDLKPDIIVLTGDYLNLSRLSDPTSAAHFRAFVSQLEAPYGIYAVRGSVEPTLESMAWLVEGTEVVWLEQEAVTVDVRGQPVTLVGVACSHRQALDVARLDRAMEGVPAEAFTVLLYHSPDLIYEAAGHQVDLYLGGHTHGGQLRLPLHGAIVTGSIYGKRYDAGLFEEGGTRMYISRGLGFEGGGMPRARFLCRPEIVSLELTGR